MTRLVAVLALCSVTACGTTGGKHLGYAIGGALALGGTIGVAKGVSGHCDTGGCDADTHLGGAFLVAGALIIAIAASSHVDGSVAARAH